MIQTSEYFEFSTGLLIFLCCYFCYLLDLEPVFIVSTMKDATNYLQLKVCARLLQLGDSVKQQYLVTHLVTQVCAGARKSWRVVGNVQIQVFSQHFFIVYGFICDRFYICVL